MAEEGLVDIIKRNPMPSLVLGLVIGGSLVVSYNFGHLNGIIDTHSEQTKRAKARTDAMVAENNARTSEIAERNYRAAEMRRDREALSRAYDDSLFSGETE